MAAFNPHTYISVVSTNEREEKKTLNFTYPEAQIDKQHRVIAFDRDGTLISTAQEAIHPEVHREFFSHIIDNPNVTWGIVSTGGGEIDLTITQEFAAEDYAAGRKKFNDNSLFDFRTRVLKDGVRLAGESSHKNAIIHSETGLAAKSNLFNAPKYRNNLCEVVANSQKVIFESGSWQEEPLTVEERHKAALLVENGAEVLFPEGQIISLTLQNGIKVFIDAYVLLSDKNRPLHRKGKGGDGKLFQLLYGLSSKNIAVIPGDEMKALGIMGVVGGENTKYVLPKQVALLDDKQGCVDLLNSAGCVGIIADSPIAHQERYESYERDLNIDVCTEGRRYTIREQGDNKFFVHFEWEGRQYRDEKGEIKILRETRELYFKNTDAIFYEENGQYKMANLKEFLQSQHNADPKERRKIKITNFAPKELEQSNSYFDPLAQHLGFGSYEDLHQRYAEREYDLSQTLLKLKEQDKIGPQTIWLLCDIDETLITLVDGKMALNPAVANTLARMESDPNVMVILFSNMSTRELLKAAEYHFDRYDRVPDKPYLRVDMAADLVRRGNKPILGIMTNGDLGYGKGPGSVFRDVYMPLYRNHDPKEKVTLGAYQAIQQDEEEKIRRYMHEGETALERDDRYQAALENIDLEKHDGKWTNSVFTSQDGQEHGVAKLTTLRAMSQFCAQHNIPHPGKIILIDDNLGCIEAIQFQGRIEFPGVKVEGIHYISSVDMKVENLAYRHLFPELLFDSERAQQKKDPSRVSNASSIEALILGCRAGDPIDFYTLAKLALIGCKDAPVSIPVDKASAFYLAQLALLLCKDGQTREAIQKFIEDNFTAYERRNFRKSHCKEDFPTIFNHFTAYDLYAGVKLVSPGTQWAHINEQIKARRSYENIIGSKPSANLLEKAQEIDRLYANDKIQITPYLMAMTLYLQCENSCDQAFMARYIEDHYRSLIVRDLLLEPLLAITAEELKVEKEKLRSPHYKISLDKVVGDFTIAMVRAGLLEAPFQLILNGIKQKLMELMETGNNTRKLEMALTKLRTNIDLFDKKQCGLSDYIMYICEEERLLEKLEEAGLNVEWFQPQIIALANEHDRCVKESADYAMWQPPQRADPLKVGTVVGDLEKMYTSIYNGIAGEVLQSSFGTEISEIFSTPFGGERLRNKRITDCAANLLSAINIAYRYSNVKSNKIELITSLLNIMQIAQEGKNELEQGVKTSVISTIPFFATKAEKNKQAAAIYQEVYQQAGKMLDILQQAYPDDVAAIAKKMNLSIISRR